MDRFAIVGFAHNYANKGLSSAVLGPIRTCAIVALVAALTACATDQAGVRVEQVRVPTPVPCVDPAQVPAEPPQVGSQLTGDAVHDLGIVAPSALELRKWGRTLYALIVPGCETVAPVH
jgi:hypothetical protein